MFRLRTKSGEFDFPNRDDLFDWVRGNYGDSSVGLKSARRGAVFAVLEIRRGELLTMDRFRFNGVRFVEAEPTTR